MFKKRFFRKGNKPGQSNILETGEKQQIKSFIPPIQTKLSIGKPGDRYEKEADRVADKVVENTSKGENIQKTEDEEENIQMKTLAGEITPLVQLQSENKEEEPLQMQEEEEEPMQMQEEEEGPVQMQIEEEEEMLQQKTSDNPKVSDGKFENELQQTNSIGRPLPAGIRQEMEGGFGADFSKVKLHDDSKADQLNSSLGSRAFTRGGEIYFSAGQFEPGTRRGKHLLAHELTHTIQQGASTSIRKQENLQETPTMQQMQVLPEHVIQGRLNDCFLLATLLSLSSNDVGRNIIRQNVRLINNNTFRVRLFELTGGRSNRTFTPRWISVDINSNEEGAIRAEGWVRAIEIAYAEMYGGMEEIGGPNGGVGIGGAGRAFEHITGRPANTERIPHETNEVVWLNIVQALEEGRHIVAGTPRRLQHSSSLPGIYGGHNYAVVGYHQSGSRKYIRIRNPWNERFENQQQANEFSSEGYTNEPEFIISFDEFSRSFVQISIDQVLETDIQTNSSSENLASTDLWSQQFEELQVARRVGNVPRPLLGNMLMLAIQEVTFPQGIPSTFPQPSDIQLVQSINSSDQIVASTSVIEAYRNPGYFWHWIHFTPHSVSQTKQYTINIIEHELLHCADISRDLLQYQSIVQNPTETGFVNYVQAHSGSHIRHMQIYAQQGSPQNFAQWSQGERISWVSAVLLELPPNLERGNSMPVEHRIERFYETANPVRKQQILAEFTNLISSLTTLSDRSSEEYQQAFGIGVTALTHFTAIWTENQDLQRRLAQIMNRRRPIIP